MSRPVVLVSPVHALDDDRRHELTTLWVESRVEAGSSHESVHRMAAQGGVTAALDRPDVIALLATVDEEPVGYLVLSDSPAGPLNDAPCTSIDQLFVRSSWRRHGVARQLLAAAATHADRSGAEAIVSNVPSQVRDANRFFARLGFSPTVVRRVTTPAALHRKLNATVESPVLSRVGLEEVIQRRRTARFRAVRQSRTPRAADA